MMKNTFSKINMVRFGLVAAFVALIMLLIPRPGQQSFSYEVNQPWKYHLLTAEFDIPIYLDKETSDKMKDSISRNFIPFVIQNNEIASDNVAKFKELMAGKLSATLVNQLANNLAIVYQHGILQSALSDSIRLHHHTTVRVIDKEDKADSRASNLDVSEMYSPLEAFQALDSMYKVAHPSESLSPDMAKAYTLCLEPNVLLDSVTDSKFRNQEYLSIAAAKGLIKKGQRIVDLGEIVTPQIYTNLQTYESALAEKNVNASHNAYYSVGQILYILVILIAFYMYLKIYRPSYFKDARIMSFFMALMAIFSALAIIMFENISYGIFLVPFAAVPIAVYIFFDARTAVMALFTSVLISALVATFQFQFVVIELVAGMVATFTVQRLSSRPQLLLAATNAFVTYCVVYVISVLLDSGSLDGIVLRTFLMFAINSVLLSFTYFLIVMIERIYGFTSALTLVELSDINNNVLRRLAEEAPGTFQHSMQVSTLAAEAARAIGANVQLVRTGALYHDIGKINSPIFFTENQHGANPHAGLSPEISAKKIISHVNDGLQIAAKEKLPLVIRNFISEHHGKGVARYFYNTACNALGKDNVRRSDFQYPGPNPQSVETTLMMMADAVEAASRSLPNHTEQSINNLVDQIIDTQMAEGLYADSPISFKDIKIVKDTFKKRLATIYHSRVTYPELNSDE